MSRTTSTGMLGWLRREMSAARTEIRQGRFQRSMAVLAAGAAVVSGFETYMQHLRGAFRNRWMWTPVWLTPPMVVAGAGAMRSKQMAHRVLPVMSAVTFLDGMLGFLLHLRGIQRMPGHFSNLQFNITMGPPLLAPLLFCAVGLLGFIASLMRREEG